MTMYPFNERREQVNRNRCPAPWCGCDMWRSRPWSTPVVFEADLRMSFAEAASMPDHDMKGVYMMTCERQACRQWARLRAADLRGGPDVDPVYVAYLWSTQPHPQPPEDMRRERMDRQLRDAIDRIQDRLRLRPVT
jgi:hypothetical protein